MVENSNFVLLFYFHKQVVEVFFSVLLFKRSPTYGPGSLSRISYFNFVRFLDD